MDRHAGVLSEADRELVFRQATSALPKWYSEQIATGMTDAELTSALEAALGIWGGSFGPDKLDVVHKGAGLKIWGGWHIVNHVTDPPLFQGAQTLAMARHLYAIANPDEPQLTLF
jgi:hypothetical protein